MSISGATSLSSYLRQQQIRFADKTDYIISPHVDLICFQAYHLAQMHMQPLHPIHLLKAMLHISGSAIEQLLTQQGLTLEKVHTTPLDPHDSPLDFNRFFERTLAFVREHPSIVSQHLLLAVLDDAMMQRYFDAWRVDREKLREAALIIE